MTDLLLFFEGLAGELYLSSKRLRSQLASDAQAARGELLYELARALQRAVHHADPSFAENLSAHDPDKEAP